MSWDDGGGRNHRSTSSRRQPAPYHGRAGGGGPRDDEGDYDRDYADSYDDDSRRRGDDYYPEGGGEEDDPSISSASYRERRREHNDRGRYDRGGGGGDHGNPSFDDTDAHDDYDRSYSGVVEEDGSYADFGHDYGRDGVETDYTRESGSYPMKKETYSDRGDDNHTPRTQGPSADEYDDYGGGDDGGGRRGGGGRAQAEQSNYFEDDVLDAAVAEEEEDHYGRYGDDALPPGVTKRDLQEDHDAMMRLLAAQLGRADWADRGRNGGAEGAASLERRLRDFKFAQRKRRDRYGGERPWGIMGLYDHLQGIRTDVEWSEDAAWRRENDEPYLSWADFEEGRKLGLNRPFFTYIMLVLCTAMLIASYGVNGWTIEPLSVNPMVGPSAETLNRLGAKFTPYIVQDGEWYRLFSPMVLHAGLIHYVLNMAALWFIGSAVELSHGFVAAAIIFVIPATGGTILSAIFLPEYISVGASGGIFGLIGACIADITMNWSLLFSKTVNETDEGTRLRHARVLVWLLLDILVNCIIGLTPFVDNFTHMGGMLYGFLCGLSTMERLSLNFFGVSADGCTRFRNGLVRFFGLILSVVLIMVSTALLVESDGGTTSPCSTCRYASCVPFPPWAGEEDKWWYCDDCHKATADAIQNEDTGYYDLLSLRCPNGEISDVDLNGQKISDREYLRNQLKTYCRQHCESLFA